MLTPEEKTELLEFIKEQFKGYNDAYATFYTYSDEGGPRISYVDTPDGFEELENTEENVEKAINQMLYMYENSHDIDSVGFFIYLCPDNALISLDILPESDKFRAFDDFNDKLTLSTGRIIHLGFD